MHNNLIELVKNTKKRKSKIIINTSFSILEKLFDIFPEIFLGIVVDLVVHKKDSLIAKIGIKEPFYQLIFLGIITAIIWSLESLFEYLGEIGWKNMAQEIQHNVRLKTYEHVQNLDMSWFNEKSTGNILNILNSDINQLERFFNKGANDIIQLIFSSIATAGVYFYLTPKMAFFSMMPIPLILVGSALLQKYLFQNYSKVREIAGYISSKLSNNLQGITVIKSFVAEKDELKEIEKLSKQYQVTNEKTIKLSSIVNPTIRTIVLLGFLVTLLYGGWLTFNNKLDVGSYTTLLFLTPRMLWPFRAISKISDSYQRTIASSSRIFELLNTPIKIYNQINPKTPKKMKGEIVFDNVDFSYIEEQNILKNVSLKIKSGEYIGLVGTTGAGKSTITKLLLRLYDPQKGTIEIDSINLKDFKLDYLRRIIGLVDQNSFLFDGTIYDNIVYGNKNASKKEIEKATNIAEIDEFINSLPNGFNTHVGERGMKLSGGQRQRVCIARAIVKDPKILIFDEATSAVDNETETAIQKSLLSLKHSRTMIVIAHRLSTVRFADKILVLSENGIAEQGTHEELILKKEIYKKLWDIQTGELNNKS
ncbi:MAG: ABC transporter ATP-binding protein [Bacteroidetes bacterium]|nr:ABC transporter ATP-binding protein [Bacteroidota bacterium]